MQHKKTLLAASAVIVLGSLSLLAVPASAKVVCNSYGDCWHTDTAYNYDRYDRDQHAQVHNDDWYFHQKWDDSSDHHFRDRHDGRGYYKSGVWIQF